MLGPLCFCEHMHRQVHEYTQYVQAHSCTIEVPVNAHVFVQNSLLRSSPWIVMFHWTAAASAPKQNNTNYNNQSDKARTVLRVITMPLFWPIVVSDCVFDCALGCVNAWLRLCTSLRFMRVSVPICLSLPAYVYLSVYLFVCLGWCLVCTSLNAFDIFA